MPSWVKGISKFSALTADFTLIVKDGGGAVTSSGTTPKLIAAITEAVATTDFKSKTYASKEYYILVDVSEMKVTAYKAPGEEVAVSGTSNGWNFKA